MVKQIKIPKYPGTDKNMFDYLVEKGDMFTDTKSMFYNEIEPIHQLFVLKLLHKELDGFSNFYRVSFTEDGHNFYLKTLSLIK